VKLWILESLGEKVRALNNGIIVAVA